MKSDNDHRLDNEQLEIEYLNQSIDIKKVWEILPQGLGKLNFLIQYKQKADSDLWNLMELLEIESRCQNYLKDLTEPNDLIIKILKLYITGSNVVQNFFDKLNDNPFSCDINTNNVEYQFSELMLILGIIDQIKVDFINN